MPDRSQQLMDNTIPSLSHTRDRDKNRRKLDAVASSMNTHSSSSTTVLSKRKRKATEKEREKEAPPAKVVPPPAKVCSPSRLCGGILSTDDGCHFFFLKKQKHATPTQDAPPIPYNPKNVIAAPIPASPRRSSHHPLPPPPPPRLPPSSDETQFFDRVKRVLDNRDLYNEFLKLVNLFAQDYIDTARLVKESRNFLGNTELYKQFRDILGWDDNKEREHFLSEQHTQSHWAKPAVAGLPERPGRIDLSEKYGSYRKVSSSVRCNNSIPSLKFNIIFYRWPTSHVQDGTKCAAQC